ncbi:MAG: formyltetrahydrofolate deformylase, partial [Rhizobacter sp.]|nr:formyltetrahydrofolate deformylase [Rhizobacter sp.]MBP6270494.1 formyltetrahydrofolate deformylase [Rhizobacter sp.]
MNRTHHYTLTFSCPDRVGIVARVTGFFAEHGGWILSSSQHADADSARYFMRVEVRADSLPFDHAELKRRFQVVATEFGMDWRISDSSVRRRVLMLVSTQEHCLYDLLARWKSQELDVDIVGVASNHEVFRGLVEWHGLPFHHIPVTKENKPEAFAKLEALFESSGADTMVLARYMQILPPSLCRKYPGQIINIHHSFLPSFAGAKPYHQAWDRGVKLIGATCHYVTEDLDEGPIIEQDVMRIDHSDA